MAPIVVVHGVFNYIRGMAPGDAAVRRAADWGPSLARGLSKVSAEVRTPELAAAHYADLLRLELLEESQSARDTAGFDDLDERELQEVAEWLAAAGAVAPEDAQNLALAPVKWMLGKLVDERGGRLTGVLREQTVGRLERAVVANLREAEAYTTWPDRRRLVRERIVGVIRREAPTVVIAHSLGSYITYETLHAHPELGVDLLVTLGSPLRVPSLARRLDPSLRAGKGTRPAGVKRWVNIADAGDLVAVPPGLSAVFPVDLDEICDNGLGFHGLRTYLANGLLAAAVLPYIS
ncbi:hypothetical protein [Streptomyces sp. B93]|uniref:hypothetical protein n=1 Tax=Streptomyces sp. B93 TaxID=2824875 RepID=UPI001B38D74B|nr:hypothetical protein [Streptomyces sp. B93]MBQ1091384.1 hypothetical protein [Streptomyces sp. B93]